MAPADDGARGVENGQECAITPGPWLAYPHGKMTCVYAKDAQHRDVFIAKEVGHLDARAIAAVPEMLPALKEAERFLDYFANGRTMFVGGGMPLDALKMVRAAIAKAEGVEAGPPSEASTPESLSPRHPDREAGGTS